MTTPEKIGVESRVAEHLPPQGLIRARFRIDNIEAPSDARFPDGDWLNVTVVARVYDLEELQRRGRVPEEPLAQGPEVPARARTDWSVVDLPLPPMPPGQYGIVAKVYSSDERYRRPFSPSNCWVSAVEVT